VDVKRLRGDVDRYQGVMGKIDQRIRKKTKVKDLNVDSNEELAQAMVAAGLADDGLMGYTGTGKIQTNKDAINRGVTDKETKALLAYRARLNTCLGTFMLPWLRTAEKSGGLLFTNWNQVKQGDGKNQVGTSTGRLSSTPPFQNIPKEFPPLAELMGLTPAQYRQVVASLGVGVMPELPLCRGYIIPYEKGQVLIDRDYSQQELRILGHYEDGVLKDAYLEDVWLDMHEHARQLILEITGTLYDRKPVKNTNFGIIYGQGAPSLAVKNDVSIEESKAIIKAILAAFPGIQDIMDDMKDRAKADEPIRTWGGREYFCEPDQYVEKFRRVMSFDYKLINLLIQGSAADCSKESLIRWCEVKDPEDRFHMTVHDQTVGSTPKGRMKEAMELMRKTMESVEFDIPILTEGSWSDKDWAHMKDFDKAGKVLYNGR
jgi:DNA polymerase I-like protein with 3'-5' exonuclease and polymerase domains